MIRPEDIKHSYIVGEFDGTWDRVPPETWYWCTDNRIEGGVGVTYVCYKKDDRYRTFTSYMFVGEILLIWEVVGNNHY